MVAKWKIPSWLFATTVVASLATVIGPLILFGVSERGLQLAARYTVRVSFPLFLLAYLTGPFVALWRTNLTRWLQKHRRYIGLSFAIAHTIHLGALTGYFVFIGVSPDAATLIGGGLAYALMFAMAATSNDWSVKKLGANWRRLHSVGLHYLWFIFLITYMGRLSGGEGGDTTEDLVVVGIVGSALVFGALLIRLIGILKRRRRAAAA
ncbi:putative sulfite oxidase subunit YedZ [Rhodobiaceae bacterium]|nr:putative sulfite oxidase subunit YedZ [Rhodobiaceae bacterium]